MMCEGLEFMRLDKRENAFKSAEGYIGSAHFQYMLGFVDKLNRLAFSTETC
jgi:hypothetical protein